MELNNIDLYAKLFVAMTGLLALLIKIKDSYSLTRNKQEIKLDLEIYDSLKKNGEFNTLELKKKIEDKLQGLSEKENESLTTFFIGNIVFIGFGMWSIDIFQNMERFNGWIIFTAFLSATGFSLIFGKNNLVKHREAFCIIGFYDQFNFRAGLVIAMVASTISYILYLKIEGFSYWIFVSGLFLVIGLRSLITNIRRIK